VGIVIIDFLNSIRYKNILLLIFIFFCFEFLLSNTYGYKLDYNTVLAYFSILISASAGYLINNILDIKSDFLNKKNQHISINKKHSIIIYFILFISSLILSSAVSTSISVIESIPEDNLFFVIVLTSNIFLFFYSYLFKHIALLGNIIISFFALLIPIISLLLHYKTITELSAPFFIINFSVFSFLITMSRELIKDIEDIDGDRLCKAKTLPIILGIEFTKYFALFFITVIILLCISFINDYDLMSYYNVSNISIISILVMILLPLFYTAFKIIMAKNKNDFTFISKLIKLDILFALFTILIYALC